MGDINLTKQDLTDLVAAAVTAAMAAANAPKPLSKKELDEIKQAQEMRKDTAASLLEGKKRARWFQESGCSHEHSKQAGGGTHCVHVKDSDHPDSAGFILCQNCQGRFRPDDPKWRKLDPDAIFSTGVFNKLFQECAQAQGEMLG